MEATRIIGLVSTAVIVGFLAFAFRRALQERRDKRPD